MTDSPETIEKVHCNSCGQDTLHLVVASRSQRGSEALDDDEVNTYRISWDTTYEMLECRGCEEVRLRRTHVFSEWNPGEKEVSLFPPATDRRKPPWAAELPPEQAELMAEVYLALQAGSKRLATMGARTLIDMVILAKVGDKGSFPEKLRALENQGFVGKIERTVVEAALNAGSAAAHRGHSPSDEHLATVMDIVESLLRSTTLADRADDLRKGTPGRKT